MSAGRALATVAAIAGATLALAAAPGALASVRGCAYRNPAHGAVPYVAQVTTDLSPRAAGPAGVCAVVDAAVRRTQRLGFTLSGAPRAIEAGGAWTLDHRLVYPKGWPQPKRPVYDPHMHVTLRLDVRAGSGGASAAGSAAPAGRWIEFNEYA